MPEPTVGYSALLLPIFFKKEKELDFSYRSNLYFLQKAM
jgi:hypothetical protein